MQNPTSGLVVNIVPLQNVQANSSGLDATAVLSKQVVAIQGMVDTTKKQINVNYISAFTGGNTIQVTSPINLSTATINSLQERVSILESQVSTLMGSFTASS
jgi:O-glycosyl hydrolase